MNNYCIYHLHDDNSNMNGYYDSTSSYLDYLNRAKIEKMVSISFSNHGGIFNWIKKKQACDKANIKYIHGLEAYMYLDNDYNKSYHIGLYAKNFDGVKELNKLYSLSTLEENFYRVPRLSYEKHIKNMSNNIIITTACLASALWQKREDEYFTDNFFEFAQNRDVFLETQYHKCEEQKEYNKLLHKYSLEYNIPLIAGTDTHSVNDYHAECRKILQKSNNSYYGDEDSFDLTWKTYDELVNAFKEQDTLPENIYMQAIENTNVLSNMIENFDLDYSFKYPNHLYNNYKKQFAAKIDREYTKMVNKKILPDNKEYTDRIKEEYDAMVEQGMESYILFVSELCDFCDESDIMFSARGSVTGSLIAFILNISDLDPVKYGLVFSRFCNKDRVSLADIDLDFAGDDREIVYNYIRGKLGDNNISRILTVGTAHGRRTIDVVSKGLEYSNLDEIMKLKNKYNEYTKIFNKIILEEVNMDECDIDLAIDNSLLFAEIIRNDEAKNKMIANYNEFKNLHDEYSNIFEYYNGVINTSLSKGFHAAGIIGSPIDVVENIGVYYKNGDINFPISVCDMKCVDSLNYVKFDILSVNLIAVIKDTYNMINEKYKKTYELDLNDPSIYDEMLECQYGVFQFESDYAFDLFKQFKPRNMNDMNLLIAAIRPSGKSYRDNLIKRIHNVNPSKEIDELLKNNYGYLVFQEDTIKFLQYICGLTGSEADTIRRAIGKKLKNVISENIPKITNGYCDNSSNSREIAKKEVLSFIKIIEDSSEYQFGLNHSAKYSSNAFHSCYLRKNYPLAYITSYFNNSSKIEDYYNGFELANIKNIEVKSIKFGKTRNKYTMDMKENIIYKGIKSIKDLGNIDFDELHKIEYNSFIDFLIIQNQFNKKQLDILIKLNFFSKFGKVLELLNIIEVYNKYYGRKSLKKDNLSQYELSSIKNIEHKETDKTIKDFNSKELCNIFIDNFVTDKKYDIIDLQINEYKYFGYIHTKYNCKNDNMYIVLDLKINKSISLTLFSIKKHKILNCKMFLNKFYFNDIERFEIYDIIYISHYDLSATKYGLVVDNCKVYERGKNYE